MMLIGFAGLGFAAYRRKTNGVSAAASPVSDRVFRLFYIAERLKT